MQAVVALLRAANMAAAAGTLWATILDGIALATWALDHPGQFSAIVSLARGIGFAADAVDGVPDPEQGAALIAARQDAQLNKHGGR